MGGERRISAWCLTALVLASCDQEVVAVSAENAECVDGCVADTSAISETQAAPDVPQQAETTADEVSLPPVCTTDCDDGDVTTVDACTTGTCTHTALPVLSAYLKPMQYGSKDRFGYALAMEPGTVAVGDKDHVQLYTNPTGTWQPDQALWPPQTAQLDDGMLAMDGDFVLASYATSWDSAAVAVFERSGATWSVGNGGQPLYTTTWWPAALSVAISGSTAVVGGEQIWIYTRTPDGWAATQVLNPNKGVHTSARIPVAVQENDLAVSYGEALKKPPAALVPIESVEIFARQGETWVLTQTISHPTAILDKFGRSLAFSGDWLAIGAPQAVSADGNAFPGAGVVYLFHRVNGSWQESGVVTAGNPSVTAGFGASLSLSGDRLLVGSVYESSGGSGINPTPDPGKVPGSGAAYVFNRLGNVWKQQAYIKALNPDPDDRFGYSVALIGNVLAIGAQGEASSAVGVGGNQKSNSIPERGAAYVYELPGL